MRLTWVAMLVLVAAMTGSAADFAGTWDTQFSGPPEEAPKTVGEIILKLTVHGDVVTGTAQIGAWPGEASIADGKVNGERLTFTATGHVGSTTGIPTCQFVANLHEGKMVLTMTAIRNAGGPLAPGMVYKYEGRRQTGH